MRRIKYTLALVFLFSNLVLAQDTLVKINGDTLIGRINLGVDSFKKEYAIVKVDRKKNRVQLLDIRSIKMANGDILKPVGYGNTYKLGKEVVAGYMTYYKVTAPNSSEKFTTDILFKMDGTYLVLGGKIGFRGRTRDFLQDCAKIAKALNDKKYKRNDLVKLTQDYNNCLENDGFSNQSTQAQQQASSQSTGQQLSKSLEQKLSDFSTLLEYSDKISNKSDVAAMFNDVAGKLRRKEVVPNYLKTALVEALKTDPKLTKLIKEVLEAK